MMKTVTLVVLAALLVPTITIAGAPKLGADAVLNAKGDGPDGTGNTADDTWQFWFELAHRRSDYGRLKLHTTTLTPTQRAKGIPRRVTGPVGGWMPNPKECEGWIYHRDWDGRFEGAWADRKTGHVYLYPYAEKVSHCAVALTYRIPKTGKYNISGLARDAMVEPGYHKHDGAVLEISEVGPDNKGKGTEIFRSDPFGDGHGRPDSVEIKIEGVNLTEGRLIRVAVHPRRWWGSDRTRLDGLTIAPAR